MTRYAFNVVIEVEAPDPDIAYDLAADIVGDALHDADLFVAYQSNGAEVPAGWRHDGDPQAPEGARTYVYGEEPPQLHSTPRADADIPPDVDRLILFAGEDGAEVQRNDEPDTDDRLPGDMEAALLLAQRTAWRWLVYVPGLRHEPWAVLAYRVEANARLAAADAPPGAFAFDGRHPPAMVDGPGGIGYRLADETERDGRPLLRGRCDTCGAPCDDDGCTADRTHEVALP